MSLQPQERQALPLYLSNGSVCELPLRSGWTPIGRRFEEHSMRFSLFIALF